MSFELEFYTKENGEVPFEEFLKTLDKKLIAKVFRDLDLLRKNGKDLHRPYSAFLRDGLFELRTQLGTNSVRSIYFFMMGSKIIIANAFLKKTNKVPNAEIERALRYKNDYLRRKK